MAVLVGICGVIAAVVLLWQVGPLRVWGNPTRVAVELTRFSSEAWAPFAMIGIYVVAALLSFPVLVLITATALAFEPFRALPISICGVLASTSLLYALGRWLMRGRVPALVARAVTRIDSLLRGRDILAVMVIRMLPIAPSSVVSVSLGVLGIPLRDALIGTVLGMAPGMVLITALGRQVRALIAQPTAEGMALLGGLLLAWLGLAVVLQRIAAAKQWCEPPEAEPEPEEPAGQHRTAS